MAAAEVDFLIEEGATFFRVLKLQIPGTDAVAANPATGAPAQAATDPVPIDLTGMTPQAQIRKTLLETAPVIAEFEVTVVDALEGIISMELPADVTSDLLPDIAKDDVNWDGRPQIFTLGYYDLKLTHDSDFVTRVIQGTVTYSDEVTRDQAIAMGFNFS